MQTSKKQKNGKAKVILAVFLFFAAVIFVQILFLLPYEHVKNQKFNTLIIGGSIAKWGIDASLLDEGDGILAENLSIGPAIISGRYEAMKGAVERYSPDTVIIELSYDGLELEGSDWTTYNLGWIIPRMVTLDSLFQYLKNDVRIPWFEYKTIIGIEMYAAMEAWEALINGSYGEYYKKAGSGSAEAQDVSYTSEEAEKAYHQHIMHFQYKDSTIENLHQMIELGRERNIRVIVVTLPLPESTLWYMTDWDEFREILLTILKDYDCEYYDFNLYRDRQKILADEYSFRDYTHLSQQGAEAVTRLLRDEILEQDADSDVENLFYDNYEEALKHSRYADAQNTKTQAGSINVNTDGGE